MRTISFAWMAALLLALPARAEGPNAESCSEIYIRAQTLRNERKLLDARAALRECTQSSCKAFIVKDCATWLDEVQSSLPTVVPVAIDAAANDVPGVKVSMDGRVLIERIEGRSIEVDPGPHTFTFEAPDGSKAEKKVIVSEGEKGKRISISIGTARAPSEAGVASDRTGRSTASPGGASPWKTVGLVTAGLGVVGAGVGGFFGLQAMSKKNDAHCDANSLCPNGDAYRTLTDAKNAGNLSTLFFIGGGVLAAGGIAMYALAPSGTVKVSPSVGSHSVTLVAQGTW